MRVLELDKVMKNLESLSKIKIRDPEQMAQKLREVLDYVEQMRRGNLSIDEEKSGFRMECETSQEVAPVSHDRSIVWKNVPQYDEKGVMVPRFVER